MRICLINPFSKFAAVRQYNLVKQFALKGHDTTLILPLFDHYSDLKNVRVEPVKNLHAIHPKLFRSERMELRMLPYIFDFFKKTKRCQFDIVHAFRPTPFSGLMGYWLAKRKKIPFIFELGDAESQSMKGLGHPAYRVWIVQWLESFLRKKSDGLTVMNKYVKEHVQTLGYNKPIEIISNGVDVSLFQSAKYDASIRKDLEVHTNAKKILLYVGKLDRVSHIESMFHALKLLPDSFGLVVVGDGKNKNKLESLARRLQIDNRCYFIGRTSYTQVPTFLKTADILLAPFVNDERQKFASNLKLFEYMASGKPIVASNVGLNRSILGRDDAVFEAENVLDLKLKIQNAYNLTPNYMDKAKEYDWNILADKALKFYELFVKQQNNNKQR
jgi:glycosyltransferase involved in cell wall biosynthesis